MATITLEKAWTYRTPLVTVDYPAGSHEVTQDVLKAAVDDGVIANPAGASKGKNDVDSSATDGSKGDPGAAQK